MQPPKKRYTFGPFQLNPLKRQLTREGEGLPLPPKVFDTLCVLLENSGRVVTKDEIIRAVWPDTFVEEGNLTVNISTLRKVLGDRGYIETLPRVGYRFAAEVKAAPDQADEAVKQEATAENKTWLNWRSFHSRRIMWALLVFPVLIAVSLELFSRLTRENRVNPSSASAKLLARENQPCETSQGDFSEPPVKVIAVLPFISIGGDSADDYLQLGMADATITKLSNIRHISVKPTSAIRKYVGQERDVIAAGRELCVEAVLEGSIQVFNDRIRVTARLVDVRDGRPLWGSQFEEKQADGFAVQESISMRLAQQLALKLGSREPERMIRGQTDNVEAHRAYWKGRYFWNKRTRQGLAKGIHYFQQAIDNDPDYAQAYVGVGDSYICLARLGLISDREALKRLDTATTKALQIDDLLAEAHTALACVRLTEWDWEGAEKAFIRALELDPNYATARHWYAEYLSAMGRFHESVAESKRALQNQPQSPVINTSAALVYYYARQYDRAIEQCQETLELDPSFFLGHFYLAWAYTGKGSFLEARAAAGKARQLENTPLMLSLQAQVCAASGARKQAYEVIRELTGIRDQSFPAYHVAKIYALLNERDLAFDWLDQSFNKKEGLLVWLRVDPHLDNLRADPRFPALLTDVGLGH